MSRFVPALFFISTLALAPSARAQDAAAPTPANDSARAAAAAERAADAAQKAAEAAQKAAEAAAKVAQAQPAAAAATPVAPAPKTPEEKKAEEKKPEWAGSIGVGLISLTGNASTITLNGTALASRQTEHWIFGLKATTSYGQSRPTGPDEAAQILALAGLLQLRGDRRLNDLVSVYLLGGAETDHIKSIEFRGYAEAGTGLIWFDTKDAAGDYQKTFFRTDLAFRFARELRFQYFPTPAEVPDVDLIAPRLGITFRYGITKDSIFIEEAEVLPNIVGAPRLVFSSLSKLTAHLTQAFSLGVAFQVNYDSAPAPTKVTTDTALTVLGEVGF